MLSNANRVNIIAMSLISSNIHARTCASDFLLAITAISYPNGHKLVMSAFKHLQESKKSTHMFSLFISCIQNAIENQGIWVFSFNLSREPGSEQKKICQFKIEGSYSVK